MQKLAIFAGIKPFSGHGLGDGKGAQPYSVGVEAFRGTLR